MAFPVPQVICLNLASVASARVTSWGRASPALGRTCSLPGSGRLCPRPPARIPCCKAQRQQPCSTATGVPAFSQLPMRLLITLTSTHAPKSICSRWSEYFTVSPPFFVNLFPIHCLLLQLEQGSGRSPSH